MKVLRESDRGAAFWWVGVRLMCSLCHREVEMERGDQDLACVREINKRRLIVRCECGSTMEHHR